jgi:NAD(P)-dependent dehydrogenase (short-subunit alcohol dehydrogenase family)/3-oxoacyl-(acyl-carrier-protein) synthase
VTAGQFQDKVVLVTGSGRGLGRKISLLFAARGAHVIINHLHSAETAAGTAAEITAAGGSAEIMRASVAKPDQVERMLAEVGRRHGRLDVLVNNAARGEFAPMDTVSDEGWSRILQTNLHGARWCARAALPLLARGGGAIINVSSVGSVRALETYAAIGASKAALEALTRYQAAEYAPQGVRVNAVSAPPIDNRVVGLFPDAERLRAALIAATPGGRLTTEEDLARGVLLLASEDAAWITGHTLIVDGGLSIGGLIPTEHRPEPIPGIGTESAEELVAVVGMGAMAPGAAGTDALWARLSSGEPAFSEPAERYRVEDFHSADPEALDRGYTRVCGVIHEDGPPDPNQDWATVWLRRALRDAVTTTSARPRDRQGLFLGMWADGSQHLEETVAVELAVRGIAAHGGDERELRALLRDHYRCAGGTPEEHLTHALARAATAGILPEGSTCLTVDTACSSALYAIDLGMRAVLDGDVDIAYCGGVLSLGPRILVLFSKLSGLSRAGQVRSFDAAADGTMFSDAAGVVALKRLSRARADGDEVLAVLAGGGVSADGRGAAIYAPNPAGQRLALHRAHAVNGLSRDEVDLVVAHATGTVVGDANELSVLAEDAAQRPVLCVSNKSLIGHTGWASGALSVIHGILSLRHELIPAQPSFTELPEASRGLPVRLPETDTPFPRSAGRPRTIGVSSFGFGGTNAHLLLSDRPGADSRSAPPVLAEELVLIAWSAHLPGAPDRAEVARRLAAGQAPVDRPDFGEPYPRPPFAEARMSGKTARAIDRCQLMALSVAARLVAEHGALWAGVEERSGIVCAHSGLPRASMEATARCYAPGIERIMDGRPEQKATACWIQELRARVPAVTEDTSAGLMANVIPARIANQYNLRGLTMTVDCGPDSGLAALHAAAGYLRRGDLDLALVLGAHGNTLGLADEAPDGVAEGAFLLALARPSTARERGWPVLARVRTALHPPAPEPGVDIVQVARGKPSYGGADSVVSVLRAVSRPGSTVLIRGADGSPQVHLEVAPAQPKDLKAEPIACRYRAVLRPRLAPAGSGRTGRAAIPPRMLLLAGSAELAATLTGQVHAAGGVVVSIDPASAAPALVLERPDEDALDAAIDRLGGPPEHIRLIASFDHTSWPAALQPALLHLQELLFLAVKWSWEGLAAGGSLGVALLDPTTEGAVHPHTALFTGMLKSLAWDLPAGTVHAVVTDAGTAERAFAELAGDWADGTGLPISYRRGGVVLIECLEPAPKPDPGAPAVLDTDSVILASGGARGITAAVLTALARRKPRLWILGRLDLAEFPAADLALPARLLRTRRAEYISQRRAAHPGESVARINARFRRLLDANEAWHNLDRFRSLAGPDRVHYLSCDITDLSAVEGSVTRVLDQEGQVDLLLNGAGDHHAASLGAKNLADFRRIRDIKVLGYHHLRTAFAARPPRRWCNFGSLAGFSGLSGELDYAAANEMLAQTARHHRAVGVEYTLAWPKWAESGIVTRDFLDNDSVEDGFSAITDAEGRRHFLTEVDRGREPGDEVIVIAGEQDLHTLHRRFPGLNTRAMPTPAYLGQPKRADSDRAQWTLTLDAARDRVLSEHLVHNVPTLPGTFALEVAAEAALALVPGGHVVAFRNAVFEAFIRAGHGVARSYLVRAHVTERCAGETTVRVTITSDVVRDGRVLRADRPHFEVLAVLAAEPARPPHGAPVHTGALPPVADPCYAPDGPVRLRGAFHNTQDCRADPNRATARWLLEPDGRPDRLAGAAIPALLLDALIRTAGLPAVAEGRDDAAVPRSLAELRLHRAAADGVLARDYPDGIHLAAERNGLAVAFTIDGIVLVEASGLELAEVGMRAATHLQSPIPE